jgi:fatty acid desaturase
MSDRTHEERAIVAERTSVGAWAACFGLTTYFFFIRFPDARTSWGVPCILLAETVRRLVLRLACGRQPLPPDPHARSRNTGLAVICLLMLLGGAEFHHCHHGTTLGISPVTVTRSNVGGPCRRNSNPVTWRVTSSWYVSIG